MPIGRCGDVELRGSALSAPVFTGRESGVPSPSYERLKSGRETAQSPSLFSLSLSLSGASRGSVGRVLDPRARAETLSVALHGAWHRSVLCSYRYSDTCLVDLENLHRL